MEDERRKYLDLEKEYNRLFEEVQHLQSAHQKETYQQEKKFVLENRSLQKALLDKTDEHSKASQILRHLEEKYAKEQELWKQSISQLEQENRKMSTTLLELNSKVSIQEKTILELQLIRKDLQTTLHIKEEDYNKSMTESQVKESDIYREREMRTKYEQRTMDLEQALTEKNEEIKNLKLQFMRLKLDSEKAEKLDKVVDQLRVEVQAFQRKEKQYLEELELSASRERKLHQEIDEMHVQVRKVQNDMDIRTSQTDVYLQELEALKLKEVKQRKLTNDAIIKIEKLNQEIASLNHRILKQSEEMELLSGEKKGLEVKMKHTQEQYQKQEKQIAQWKEYEMQFHQQQNESAQVLNRLNTEMMIRERDITHLKEKVEDYAARLAQEAQSRKNLMAQHKEKLQAAELKIQTLERNSSELSGVNKESRGLLSEVRQELAGKDQEIRGLSQKCDELEGEVHRLKGIRTKERSELEAQVSRQSHELSTLKEKLERFKSKSDEEVTQLEEQIEQKNRMIDNLRQELDEARPQVKHYSQMKDQQEVKISELTAAITNRNQQVTRLQNDLKEKEKEIQMLDMKQQSMIKTLERMEEEVTMYRNVSLQKDTNMMKLQTKVNDLFGRLKSQVTTILDKDKEVESMGSWAELMMNPTTPQLNSNHHPMNSPSTQVNQTPVQASSPYIHSQSLIKPIKIFDENPVVLMGDISGDF